VNTTRPAAGAARVLLPGPLDLAASLAPLSRWGDDLVDRWDGVRLAGTAATAAGPVPFVAVARGDLACPWLDVLAPSAPAEVAAALTARFPPMPPEFADLCRDDPVVARLAGRFPGLRPVLRQDLLTALVHCVSAQQVNLAWAATTRRRLALRFGRRHEVVGVEVHSHDAARLAAASVAEVRSLQFTTAKAAALIEVARAVAAGRLALADLAALPDAEVVARLTATRGIGTWSAGWVLARTLGRPVVVTGDLGVRRAVGAAYRRGALPAPDEVRRATAHWGGAALAAQALLLHAWAVGALSAVDLSPAAQALPEEQGPA
jgi:3-methyladenine DNA glycosylase/8-oxoguanine DNA glycosylase